MPRKISEPDGGGEQDSQRRSSIIRDFWCFISYRRTDNQESGREWATWLQQQLETYEIPPDLVGTLNERGQEIPAQIFPVFRDEDELSAGELNHDITEALAASKTLVVVCSPRITESRYCADEIRYFKSLLVAQAANPTCMQRPRPFLVIIDGDPLAAADCPANCFPDPIRYAVNEHGELTTDPAPESLWLDLRLPDGTEGWASKEAHRTALVTSGVRSSEVRSQVESYTEQLDSARLRLIAGILGVPLGELTRRDKAYQLRKSRRRQRLTAILATVFLALAVAAMIAGVIAIRNEKRTRETLAQSDFAEGLRLSTERDTPEALAYFARALRNDPQHLIARAHLESLLRQRWWVASTTTMALPPEIENVVDAEFFDETSLAIHSSGTNGDGQQNGDTLWMLDTKTGQAASLLEPEPGGQLEDLQEIDPGNDVQVKRWRDGAGVDLLRMNREGEIVWQSNASDTDQLSLSTDGSRAAIIDGDRTRIVTSVGNLIHEFPGAASSVQLNRDGSRALVTLNRTNLKVLDTDSGNVLLAVDDPGLVSNTTTCQLSPLGTALTYLTRDHRFFRGDLRDGEPVPSVLQDYGGQHFFPLSWVAFSTGNEHLFTSRNERIDYTEVNIYESQYGNEIYQRLIPESDAIADLAFDKMRMLALAIPSGLWTFQLPEERITSESELIVFEPVRSNEPPRAVAFSPSGQLLSIGDSQVHFWKLPDGPGGRESDRRKVEWDALLAFLTETELLVLNGGAVCIYDLKSGELQTTNIQITSPDSISESIPTRVDRTHNHLLLPVASDTGSNLEIWDLNTETLLDQVPISITSVQSAEENQMPVGPGNLILDGHAWAVGKDGHPESIGNLDKVTAISNDGRLVHRLTDSGSEVWDVIKRTRLGISLEQLNEVVFDPDGSTLLCRHQDDSIRLWPVDLSEPLSPPIRLGVDELRPFDVSEGFLVLRVERRVSRRRRARGFAVFDTRSFTPVSRPVFEEISNCTLLLSPEFGTVVEWNENLPLRVIPLFRVGEPDRDDWLPDVAESIGGLRLDSANVYQILHSEERKKTLEQHSAELRREGLERLLPSES